MDLKEKIIELYLSENNLSLRYWGVASRLNVEAEETRKTIDELLSDNILFKQSGYYQLNPPHLWKNQQYVKKYSQRTEENIINSARDFLLSVASLFKEKLKCGNNFA